MSVITKVSSLINGHQETVDLSINTLGVEDIEINGVSLSQAETHAFFTGTVPGTSTSVTITANNPGSVGNSIALVFTGSNSITSEIATWNGLNPSNQATLSSGDGSQVPSSQTLPLSGGFDSGSTAIGDNATYVNFTPTSATIAGALEGIDAALTGGGGSTQKVDKFTLNSADISNKYVTLSSTPTTAGDTILLVEDAPNMFYGVDFTVTGNQLGWNGLSLDGIFSSGDNLTITYST